MTRPTKRTRLLKRRKQQSLRCRKQLSENIQKHAIRLEEISGMTAEAAREELKQLMVQDAKVKAAAHVQEIEEEAQRTGRHRAQKVVLTVLQRIAASLSVEYTTSVVHLDSDEQKGRIIGREGRNIKSFEAATGTEVVVDDTPGAVVISCFDPVKREIARRALEKLLADGRIHPASIERFVAASSQTLENEMMEEGQRTLIDLNIHGVHPNLVASDWSHAISHQLRTEPAGPTLSKPHTSPH